MSDFEMLLADYKRKLQTGTGRDYVTWVEASGAAVYINLSHIRLALFYPDRCEIWLGDSLVHETRDPVGMEMLRKVITETAVPPSENGKRKGTSAAS